MRLAVLSGGVGGGRFLRGLVRVTDETNLTIIGNVGDDLEILSVHVSPDLDSVLYALAGIADEERGWGRACESWHALETVSDLGGDAWFRLGDRDLGVHLVRTQILREGRTLTEATAFLARALGLRCALLPATDDTLRTVIHTPAGAFPFQTWFVARRHVDEVTGVRYEGADSAVAAAGVVAALEAADVILITPSNPYVSIHPILAVGEIRAALERSKAPRVAVSPVIGGRAVKGPVDRMLRTLAGGTEPVHVASCYEGVLDALVIDEADADGRLPADIQIVVSRTLMSNIDASERLAKVALDAALGYA